MNVCTCWTSLVFRVISDGAPNSVDLAQPRSPGPAEQRAAHVPAEAHRGRGAEPGGHDRGDT